ncbi:hypothetical protein Arub01_41680 [Actinomadura rubrobrunea]|uniref:Uncharacterized protein n=1 Tax=Actinomadura rubrobrunea TaxID=115335 RepID=A0A9W6PWV5_9ACTN|nr:hypothetical protein [Actinomadura rubrobrunea]GLW65924.1 hypothetical protein Arub01_41680 [Actinomadura rubrobrunea]
MDATAHLEALRDELIRRQWKAQIGVTGSGSVLRVQHPAQHRLNDDIACDGAALRWEWGQGIAPATEVPDAADRIQSVLREDGS